MGLAESSGVLAGDMIGAVAAKVADDAAANNEFDRVAADIEIRGLSLEMPLQA